MSLPMPSAGESCFDPLTGAAKARSHGKFFFVDEKKVFLRGVTYGPFSPSQSGLPFPEASKVELDFALMRELGANTLRTFSI